MADEEDLFPAAPAPDVPTSVRTTKLEKEIEKELVRRAKAEGWRSWKFQSASQRSVPDRIFAKDGHVVFMELKRAGETPTDAQDLEMKKLREAGATVTWVDNVEAGLAFLRRFA
jgi:Holliday junction resolvase